MPNAEKIVHAVEASNLVDAEVVDQLRRKLERAPTMGLREAIKWLAAKRHITTAQGGRLLASIESAADQDDDEFDLSPNGRNDDARLTRGAPAAKDDEDLAMTPVDEPSTPPVAGKKPPSRTAAASSSARW